MTNHQLKFIQPSSPPKINKIFLLNKYFFNKNFITELKSYIFKQSFDPENIEYIDIHTLFPSYYWHNNKLIQEELAMLISKEIFQVKEFHKKILHESDENLMSIIAEIMEIDPYAKIDYKDFDNEDQSKTISLPVNVYTREEALELGLIQNPNYIPYIIGVGILILWYVIRKVRKKRKNKGRK